MSVTRALSSARGARIVVLAGALTLTAFGVWRGPVRFVRQGGAAWVNILPATFAVWEQQPFGEHYLLAFLNPDAFARGEVYTHYTQPWLMLQYVLLQPLRWGGMTYERAQMALCLPQFAVIVLLVAAHLRTVGRAGLRRPELSQYVRLAAITLAAAGLFTLPSFWVALVRFNPEQYFFLPAMAFCHLAAADARGRIHTPAGWLAMLAVALFAPAFAPFAVLSWIVLWELDPVAARPLMPRRRRLAWLAAIAFVAAAAFLLPSLAAKLTSHAVISSGFGFRSGLDGSQAYFSSMLEAVLAPSYPPGRAWHLWPWPLAAVFGIVCAAASSRQMATRMLRMLFISWLPFLWMLVVLPQMVANHPYYFDFHLTLGATFCVTFWLQRPELDAWVGYPAGRLAILLALTALVMTNLIDLARLGRMAG